MKSQGFTLIEILLVVGISVLIFAFSTPYSLNFYRTQLVEEVRNNVISALQQARHNAVLQKNDSSFGVTLSEVSDSYVLFQGEDYNDADGVNGRDSSLDEVYPVISEITFSDLTDVVFSKLTGLPSATGTITISYDSVVKTILVEDFGVVSKSN